MDIWVPNLKVLAQNVGDYCETCAMVEPKAKRRAVIKPIIPEYPMHIVQFDFVQYAKDDHGFEYEARFMDLYSKKEFVKRMYSSFFFLRVDFDRILALQNNTMEHAEEAAEEAFAPAGVFLGHTPKIFQSDNGKDCKNELLTRFCVKHGIKEVHGSPYSPSDQGQVQVSAENFSSICSHIHPQLEKRNQADQRMLAKDTFKTAHVWSERHKGTFTTANRIHHSTTGISPNFTFGVYFAEDEEELLSSLPDKADKAAVERELKKFEDWESAKLFVEKGVLVLSHYVARNFLTLYLEALERKSGKIN
jgi:hypothetical protein